MTGMKLSIIIVNYNVKYFIEQCLQSVRVALKDIPAEVFVVDNNSVDGSQALIKEKFPEVHLIENTENFGFSKANNQAIKKAKGEYILLLNPDTLVEEDTFTTTISYLDEHPKAGGLGVKMIDGKGNFLPESKRALPTPRVAFYKIFGLAKFFPRSKKFGKYHLTYLDKEKIHEVDVLSGAFMMIRKKVLDEIGLLDENFFMYGEDIDLSYRITKADYKNIYFPKTRIIHYKGESTKKNSVNYVFVFYNAMIIFARKHFTPKNARLFSSLIQIAIYCRAGISIFYRFLKRIFLPLLDAALIYGGMLLIKKYWEEAVIFPEGGHYPIAFIAIALPAYILIWLSSIYFSGGYDKPIRIKNILKGVFIGSFIILVIYALLDESMRFSRALILLGTVWVIIVLLFNRFFLSLFGVKTYAFGENKKKKYLIVGDKMEAARVEKILRSTVLDPDFVGIISNKQEKENGFLGRLDQLKEIIHIYKIDELIFCSASMSSQEIIDQMAALQSLNVEYKIAPPESISIIGSNSINAADELYVININSISTLMNKRNKRLLDLFFALLFLAFYPILFFIVKKPFHFFRNIFYVLIGKRSWVSYNEYSDRLESSLPKIKKGILNTADSLKTKDLSKDVFYRLNITYARNYKVGTDFNIIVKNIRELGRK